MDFCHLYALELLYYVIDTAEVSFVNIILLRFLHVQKIKALSRHSASI